MAYINGINCCGIGEVIDLHNRSTVASVIKDAKELNKGFLIANFAKYQIKDKEGYLTGKFEDEFAGEQFMEKLLHHGFMKLPAFVNPNSGNIVQPLFYALKEEEVNTKALDIRKTKYHSPEQLVDEKLTTP